MLEVLGEWSDNGVTIRAGYIPDRISAALTVGATGNSQVTVAYFRSREDAVVFCAVMTQLVTDSFGDGTYGGDT